MIFQGAEIHKSKLKLAHARAVGARNFRQGEEDCLPRELVERAVTARIRWCGFDEGKPKTDGVLVMVGIYIMS